MRPLTERLRQVVDRADDIGSRNLALMQESADLIEDLQSKLDRCRAELDDARKCADLWKADHDALALRLDKFEKAAQFCSCGGLDIPESTVVERRGEETVDCDGDGKDRAGRVSLPSRTLTDRRGGSDDEPPSSVVPDCATGSSEREGKPAGSPTPNPSPSQSAAEEERDRRWVPKEWNPDLCVNCGQPYHAHNTLTNECPARASEGQPREWSCPKHGKFVNASGNCRDCEAERALSGREQSDG